MRLVRRARKSIRERRMKACISDLNTNLSKVEMRVYRRQKAERESRREVMGIPSPVPRDVLLGRMNPQLYDVECRLHEAAGLPRPLPYPGYRADIGRNRRQIHRIGFVEFRNVMQAVRRINMRTS